MRKRSGIARHQKRGWLAVLGLLALPSVGFSQLSPPLVRTTFTVGESDFRQNYSADALDRVIDTVSARMADLMEKHYPFLRWVPASDSERAAQATAQITFTLTSTGAGFAQAIELVPTAMINSSTIEFDDPPIIPLYAPFDDQPTQEPLKLIKAIADTLTMTFRSDDFRAEFHSTVLRHIPLVSAVEVLEQDHQVAVPLPWDSLRAAIESVFRVTFVSTPPDEATKDGSMDIQVQGKLRGADHEPVTIRCTIISFDFPPHFKKEPGVWFPQIPTIMSHVENATLKVYMLEYHFDPNINTDGTLVTRLPEGGGS